MVARGGLPQVLLLLPRIDLGQRHALCRGLDVEHRVFGLLALLLCRVLLAGSLGGLPLLSVGLDSDHRKHPSGNTRRGPVLCCEQCCDETDYGVRDSPVPQQLRAGSLGAVCLY